MCIRDRSTYVYSTPVETRASSLTTHDVCTPLDCCLSQLQHSSCKRYNVPCSTSKYFPVMCRTAHANHMPSSSEVRRLRSDARPELDLIRVLLFGAVASWFTALPLSSECSAGDSGENGRITPGVQLAKEGGRPGGTREFTARLSLTPTCSTLLRRRPRVPAWVPASSDAAAGDCCSRACCPCSVSASPMLGGKQLGTRCRRARSSSMPTMAPSMDGPPLRKSKSEKSEKSSFGRREQAATSPAISCSKKKEREGMQGRRKTMHLKTRAYIRIYPSRILCKKCAHDVRDQRGPFCSPEP
eukprot:4133385-Prymnesium_polylepis.2